MEMIFGDVGYENLTKTIIEKIVREWKLSKVNKDEFIFTGHECEKN